MLVDKDGYRFANSEDEPEPENNNKRNPSNTDSDMLPSPLT